jgi:hypothetical protein
LAAASKTSAMARSKRSCNADSSAILSPADSEMY